MWRLFLSVVCAAVCLPGCAGPVKPSQPINSVTGKVEYGGVPVWEGQLTLIGPDNKISVATLTKDGTFRVSQPPLGRVKAALANYPSIRTASVAQQEEPLPGQARCQVDPRFAVRLPHRLSNPETSELEIQIDSGEQQVNIVVPLREGDPDPVVRPSIVFGSEVGDHAPEIIGEDLQGLEMRLSEFRGQVVVVLFWAHWCSLCRERFEGYRNLVESLEGQDFVLLGVNCDPERFRIDGESRKSGINWRSWWDGAAVGGPVSSAWAIEGLPCSVLIDRHGIIRHRNPGHLQLESAISQLISEKHERDY